jgi:muramidase (phage lysozyme)
MTTTTQKQVSPAPPNTPPPGVNQHDWADLLKQVRQSNAILRAQHEWKELILLVGTCAVCAIVANATEPIVNGIFSANYNYRQLEQWGKACYASPWDCFRGKVAAPALNPFASPDTNVSAMLDLVAWAEGTDNKYNVSYTGVEFQSFTDHPRQIRTANGISSDAAGRYQFLSPTWDTLAKRHGYKDFSPANQDRAAIELINECEGYGAAVRGDVRAFTNRCWKIWASLHSEAGHKLDKRQRSIDLKTLEQKYIEFQRLRGGNGQIQKPLPSLRVTSPMLPHRINPVSGKLQPHNGTDYACALGEIVRAPISGIFRKGNDDPNGFGNSWGSIEGNGQTITIGHTQKLLVSDGATVTAGQPIAECGAEGSSTGPHLHLEIRARGILVDPEKVLGRS